MFSLENGAPAFAGATAEPSLELGTFFRKLRR